MRKALKLEENDKQKDTGSYVWCIASMKICDWFYCTLPVSLNKSKLLQKD